MKDLDKLQKKIDALLASETEESLTEWLFKERYGDLSHILGKGSFVSISGKVGQNATFRQEKMPVKFNSSNSYIKPTNNSIAA